MRNSTSSGLQNGEKPQIHGLSSNNAPIKLGDLIQDREAPSFDLIMIHQAEDLFLKQFPFYVAEF